MAAKNVEAELSLVKMMLRSVVDSAKEVKVSRIQSEYQMIVGSMIDYNKLGYKSLNAFFESIPDVLQVGRSAEGELVCRAVHTETTKHLAHLTKATKKKSSKKSKFKPSMMRRPALPRTAFTRGHSYHPRGGASQAPRGASSRGGVGGRGHAASTRGFDTPRGSFPRGGVYRGARGADRSRGGSYGSNDRGARSYGNYNYNKTGMRDTSGGDIRNLSSQGQYSSSQGQYSSRNGDTRENDVRSRSSPPVVTFNHASLNFESRQTLPSLRDSDKESWDLDDVKATPKSNVSSYKPPSEVTSYKPPSVVSDYNPPTPARTPEKPRARGKPGMTPNRNQRSTFSSALKQTFTQDTHRPDFKVRVASASDEIVREAKAAAAHAVTAMKDVPPRFAKLSSTNEVRYVEACDESLEEGEIRDDDDIIDITRTISPVAGVVTTVVRTPSPVIREPSPVFKAKSPVPKEKSPVAKERSPVAKGTSPVPMDTSAMSEDDVVLPADTLELESLITDYKTVLMHHCQRWRSRPVYDVLSVGKETCYGFACTVRVLDDVIGSYGIFGTKKEAEVAAAKQACEKLGLIKEENVSRKQTSQSPNTDDQRTYNEEFIRDRIRKILARKTNGLWATRLPMEYKEQFSDDPPDKLLEDLKKWPDIVMIEDVDGTSKQILYPSLTPTVRLTSQGGKVSVCKIPDAETPKVGDQLSVLMAQVYDCSHFFVQRKGPELPKLMAQLNEIYEARGSPKGLINAEPMMYCVARYKDEQWYRAQILSVSNKEGETTFDVLYIDFGNCETVPAGWVRRILDNLCTLPAQAVRCCLADCYPPQGDQWAEDSEAVSEMEKQTTTDDGPVTLTMAVEKVNADQGCVVRLYHPGNPDMDFASWLISEDLAAANIVSEEPPPLELPMVSEWDVYVCYINTTCDIRVRLIGPQYSEELLALEKTLDDLVTSGKVTLGSSGPKKGSACIAVLKDEEGEVSYNRVRVQQVDGTKALVEFLDHGDSEEVEVSTLRSLPAKYNQLPYQAITIKLTGLEAFENNDSVREKLLDLAFGIECVADVDDRLEKVSLTLWDTSTDEDVNINETVAKVLQIEELAPKIPNKGGTLEGYVSHVAEDGKLYFQVQGPGLQALETLADEMNSAYSQETSAQVFVSRPEVSKLYACRYDDEWHRVRIDKVIASSRKVVAFFVDSGYTEVVAYNALRANTSLKELKRLPFQAIECSQFSLPPPGLPWTPRAVDRVCELCPPGEPRTLEVIYPGPPPQVEVYWMDEITGELECASDVLGRETHWFVEELGSGSGSEEAQAQLNELEPSSDEGHTSDQSLTPVQSSATAEPADSPAINPVDSPPMNPVDNPPIDPVDDCTETATDLDHRRPSAEAMNTALPDDWDSGDSSPERANEESDDEKALGTPPGSPPPIDLTESVKPIEDASTDSAKASSDTSVLETRSQSPLDIVTQNTAESPKANGLSSSDDRSKDIDLNNDPSKSGDLELQPSGSASKEPSTAVDLKRSSLDPFSGVELDPVTSKLLPLPPPLELPKSGEDIFVQFVADPWNFWAIQESHRGELYELTTSMAEYYSKDRPPVAIDDLLPDQVYAARADDCWYRAAVKMVLRDIEQVKIHFIDYGDYNILSPSEIRVLPLGFRTLPFLAFQCRLEGIKPTDSSSDWPRDAITRFEELTLERTILAWIHGSNDDSGTNRQRVLSVTLVDNANTTNAFLHNIMLNEGLAVK